MATKETIIKGKAMWAKVFEQNRDLKGYNDAAVPFDGFYKIDVILDKENKAIYKASGTAGKGKFDDDGNFIASLKRKHKDRFEWASGAPKVTKPDGTEWNYEKDGIIPNGSEVEVKFSVYTTTLSPGTRLETVKVLKVAEMEERKEEAPPMPAAKKETADMEIPF